ncbi:MAG TPA: hypothetical protein VM054_02235 [bacterium]|nr:hypothetical protein [bacterium]
MGKYVSIAAAALLICLSCTTSTDGDGDGYDTTTVLGVLNLFVDVWNDGDMDTYRVLLDEDEFTFYFDPQDVGGGHDIPPSWGYTEEITAVTNLFNAVGAENVDVQLDLSEVTEPEEGVETYKVENIEYEVRVHVEEEDIIYPANAYLDMEFTKVDGRWVITEWWDKANMRLPGIEECTWGEIKALYEK